MRHIEYIVKASCDYALFTLNLMREDAEELLVKLYFGYAVMIIESGLSAPADMENGVNMSFAPFHYFTKLIPILNLFEGQMLNRRSGDDHSVKVSVFYIIENLIESEQMLLARIL